MIFWQVVSRLHNVSLQAPTQAAVKRRGSIYGDQGACTRGSVLAHRDEIEI